MPDIIMVTLLTLTSVNGLTAELTRLKSSAARYGIVEEWFVEEQGTFIEIFLVVEVLASP